MQMVLALDWVSVVASVVAFLSLVASVFSAVGAARSADVALSAERRIQASERTAALRELVRTAASVQTEARLAKMLYEQASRSAIAIAACYSNTEKKREFVLANGELQKKITALELADNTVAEVNAAMQNSDEWIAQKQLELDKKLAELAGEKAWATMRADQLTYVNRCIADDVTASERSRGIYVRQDHNGLLA